MTGFIIQSSDKLNKKGKQMKFSTYKQSNKEEITQLFIKVFSDSEGQTEGSVIGGLASDLMAITKETELAVFIATTNEKIVAAVIFSKLTFAQSKINACILSPMAVDTSQQGKGIGQQLINFAINSLKENGVELVITYGDINFYSKVGFEPTTEELVKAPLPLSHPEGWLGQSLISEDIEAIAGNSSCVEALNKPEIW